MWKGCDELKLSLRRLAAYWIDFMLLAFLLVGIQWLLFNITSGFPFDVLNNGYKIEIWVLISVSLPVWLYFICCEYYKYQTLGKRMFSIKVRNIEGSNLTWGQVVLRTFIKLLPWEITHIIILIPEPWFSLKEVPQNINLIYVPNVMILAYIFVLLLSKGKRSIHDYIAKTTVRD